MQITPMFSIMVSNTKEKQLFSSKHGVRNNLFYNVELNQKNNMMPFAEERQEHLQKVDTKGLYVQ